jgi:glutathione S-transferase
MDIKLYYTPQTRSLRPRWLLEELGLPYRLQPIDLFGGEAQMPAYLRINPLGAVPAMEIDGEVMLESGAMCHWLADVYPEKNMAPALHSPVRRAYEQWMFFAPGTLEPPIFYAALHASILPDAQRVAAFVPWAMQRHAASIKVVNAALGTADYLIANTFSAADIMVGSILMWKHEMLQDYPALQVYVSRLKQRSAYQRAIAN